METIIRTENLSFKYFLHYPDIRIRKHAVTFISGRSGCGKSTLFKLLNATVTPAAGSVYYYNEPILDMNTIELRRKILLAKQVPFLFRGTVLSNFQTFHEYHESICPDAEEIHHYLKLCCIETALSTICDTMSGGEQQRVFLSIALSMRPEVLLLDEPTAALNQELSHQVLAQIIKQAKQQGMTLVIISHDMNLQSVYAEDIINLEGSNVHHE